MVFILRQVPGGRLNIKMLSYQYRDSHVKDKTISPTVLYLTWESPYVGKTVFILRWTLDQILNSQKYLLDELSILFLWVFETLPCNRQSTPCFLQMLMFHARVSLNWPASDGLQWTNDELGMTYCGSSIQFSFSFVLVNSSPPGQNGRHLADDIFRLIFMNEKSCILIKISLKFVP